MEKNKTSIKEKGQGRKKKNGTVGEVNREANNNEGRNMQITCLKNAGSTASSEYYDEAVGDEREESTGDKKRPSTVLKMGDS